MWLPREVALTVPIKDCVEALWSPELGDTPAAHGLVARGLQGPWEQPALILSLFCHHRWRGTARSGAQVPTEAEAGAGALG